MSSELSYSGEYQRLSSAVLDGRSVTVTFANGDVVSLPLDELVPSAISDRVSGVESQDFELRVMSGGESYEVSWLSLRERSDADFREYLEAAEQAEAERVGERLRALRTERGLSARAVAEAAGIAPMSLSRIERGEHDVVYKTLRKILGAMECTLDDLSRMEEPRVHASLISRARSATGLPAAVIRQIVAGTDYRADQVRARLSAVFGWSVEQLSTSAALPAPSGAAAVRFRAATSQAPRQSSYFMWADYLARVAAQCFPVEARGLPENPLAIRDELTEGGRAVDFEALIDWCLTNGVLVIPLTDPGRYFAGCFLVNHRPVVVLKQQNRSLSRWLYDLGHELGHAAMHLSADATGWVDTEPPLRDAKYERDEVEIEADDFAAELLMGDVRELESALVDMTGQRLQALKNAVARLASERKVDPGVLANHMAYRLSLENTDWWGTASNLQRKDFDPVEHIRGQLRMRLDLSQVSEPEQKLLKEVLL